ncbi:MAG: hypothetical protein EOM35_07045 [Negativicutes bacterium]|nr:hypothetical protein [Negativicutes bacterium]
MFGINQKQNNTITYLEAGGVVSNQCGMTFIDGYSDKLLKTTDGIDTNMYFVQDKTTFEKALPAQFTRWYNFISDIEPGTTSGVYDVSMFSMSLHAGTCTTDGTRKEAFGLIFKLPAGSYTFNLLSTAKASLGY